MCVFADSKPHSGGFSFLAVRELFVAKPLEKPSVVWEKQEPNIWLGLALGIELSYSFSFSSAATSWWKKLYKQHLSTGISVEEYSWWDVLKHFLLVSFKPLFWDKTWFRWQFFLIYLVLRMKLALNYLRSHVVLCFEGYSSTNGEEHRRCHRRCSHFVAHLC